MLLQNPKLGKKSLSALTLRDYQRYHRVYIRAYKRLHDEVAAFSVLPERFVEQVEPAIEKYLSKYENSSKSDSQTDFLRVLTDFITRFHAFMNEATEMFNEHQLLSDETFTYLQRMAEISTRFPGAGRQGQPAGVQTNAEKDYIALIPELEHLLNSLAVVKSTVRATEEQLRGLEPYWIEIKGRIGTASPAEMQNPN